MSNATLTMMPRPTTSSKPSTAPETDSFPNPTSKAYTRRVIWSRGFSEFAQTLTVSETVEVKSMDQSPGKSTQMPTTVMGQSQAPAKVPEATTSKVSETAAARESDQAPKRPTMKGYRTKGWYAWSFSNASSNDRWVSTHAECGKVLRGVEPSDRLRACLSTFNIFLEREHDFRERRTKLSQETMKSAVYTIPEFDRMIDFHPERLDGWWAIAQWADGELRNFNNHVNGHSILQTPGSSAGPSGPHIVSSSTSQVSHPQFLTVASHTSGQHRSSRSDPTFTPLPSSSQPRTGSRRHSSSSGIPLDSASYARTSPKRTTGSSEAMESSPTYYSPAGQPMTPGGSVEASSPDVEQGMGNTIRTGRDSPTTGAPHESLYYVRPPD
ncbi:hypothetical protein BCR39DRAFT_588112 [Naematelia encephala]|uniref:Uncharacterized protein n=1 Tax=Naematelia encephala TaxID=71784 RepID=A0A1Y2B5E9_9TREE|nr:hypothetical protein BCR39DRAFT_588112 [Naematelia encephala]